MRNNLSPISLVLDPNAPRPFLEFLPAHLQRKIAARWQEWVPWVWIYLRQRRYAPAGSPELARLRRRHSEDLLGMIRAGIGMRLIRRHRLDDPRITDELRAALVRAAVDRRKTASLAGRRRLSNPHGVTVPELNNTSPGAAAFADSRQALESSPAPPQAPRNIFPPQDKPVPIDVIRKRVSEHFHLRELRDQDLKVRSNRLIITFPRQLAMYIARQLTTASLPEIGRQFGGKHHTTVLHSINKIEQMRRSDRELNHTITRLVDAFQR
jgi:DnaA-like protein